MYIFIYIYILQRHDNMCTYSCTHIYIYTYIQIHTHIQFVHTNALYVTPTIECAHTHTCDEKRSLPTQTQVEACTSGVCVAFAACTCCVWMYVLHLDVCVALYVLHLRATCAAAFYACDLRCCIHKSTHTHVQMHKYIHTNVNTYTTTYVHMHTYIYPRREEELMDAGGGMRHEMCYICVSGDVCHKGAQHSPHIEHTYQSTHKQIHKHTEK